MISLSPLSTLPPGNTSAPELKSILMANHHEDLDFLHRRGVASSRMVDAGRGATISAM